MLILGIESSCDETAAAVVENGHRVLSNAIVSQIDLFKVYGGVIPEIAARSHIEAILPVVHQALNLAHCSLAPAPNQTPVDAIAVTHTPGLVGSLLIGTLTARALSILNNLPLYPTHHLKSHIYANWLSGFSPTFPLLALVISGGHTQIIYMSRHDDFRIIGTTHDDAVGEVFDKVAKILGLPYPGGPAIAAAAKTGNWAKYPLPIPQVSELDFSFSGLKTAVLRAVQKDLNLPITTPSHELKNHLTAQQVADFAASFEHTVVKIFLKKLQKATKLYPDAKSLLLAGGVSANQTLRAAIQQAFQDSHALFFPNPKFSTDNGAMVASAAYYSIQSGEKPTDPYLLDISPRSTIT